MTEEVFAVNPFRELASELQSEFGEEAPHPEGSLEEPTLEDALLSMLDDIIEMTRIAAGSLSNGSPEDMDRCESLAKKIHAQEQKLTMRLLSPRTKDRLPRDLIRFPYRLERVGDILENVLTCSRLKARDAIPFSEEGRKDVDRLFSELTEMMTTFRDAFVSPGPDLLESVLSRGASIAEYLAGARSAHWERLWAGLCDPHSSSMFLDILDSIKWANEYMRKLASTLLEVVTGNSEY